MKIEVSPNSTSNKSETLKKYEVPIENLVISSSNNETNSERFSHSISVNSSKSSSDNNKKKVSKTSLLAN